MMKYRFIESFPYYVISFVRCYLRTDDVYLIIYQSIR